MPDDNDFVDGNSDGNTGKGLRSQLEAALAELKDLRDIKTKWDAREKADASAKVFEDLKIIPRLAKKYTGEPDKAAVKAWADEYAEIFGADKVYSSEAGTETPTPTVPNVAAADDALAAAFAATQKASQAAQTASGGLTLEAMQSKAAELRSRGKNVTQADLKQFMVEAGFPDTAMRAPSQLFG